MKTSDAISKKRQELGNMQRHWESQAKELRRKPSTTPEQIEFCEAEAEKCRKELKRTVVTPWQLGWKKLR